MNPVRGGRYARSAVLIEDDGTQRLTIPARIRGPREDDIIHPVSAGETLETVAWLYYDGLVTDFAANMLYWVIGDYQDDPVVDPFAILSPGSELRLPSRAVVASQVVGARTG